VIAGYLRYPEESPGSLKRILGNSQEGRPYR